MNYTDLWQLLQNDILGVLSADEMIGTRLGVAIEPGDLESVINSKLVKSIGAGLDGKCGVGFLVLPIERAEDENPSMPGGPLKLTVTVHFVENVTINRSSTGTQIPIRIYAARAEKILKLYTPVGFAHSLIAATPAIFEFTDNKDKNLRVGAVEFFAREADEAPMQRLNRPQIIVAAATYPFTVTVLQPAALKIFYTLDGSHPYEGNPVAKQYAGPVQVIAPGMFRARAYGVGDAQLASDTAAYNFV